MAKSTLENKPTYELQTYCAVCDRVRWGNYQYLGFGKWRHEECAPGTKNWRDYYAGVPKSKRSDAGDTLFRDKDGKPFIPFTEKEGD